MHPNGKIIEKFYSSFQKRDADGMISCYDPAIVFSDPVFGELAGPAAGAMWRMLCSRASDLDITFHVLSADDATGAARWVARYTFSKTGRRVHNVISASFVFKNGLIIRHDDRFSLWKWSGMALGPLAFVFGWTPFIKNRIRNDARRGLDLFLRRRA